MAVNLNLAEDVFVPKFYPLLLDYSHRWEIYMGSAGSAKSYFITQKLIIRCCREPIKILVCRRYGSTIRNTCFSLFKDVLAKWQLTPFVEWAAFCCDRLLRYRWSNQVLWNSAVDSHDRHQLHKHRIYIGHSRAGVWIQFHHRIYCIGLHYE